MLSSPADPSDSSLSDLRNDLLRICNRAFLQKMSRFRAAISRVAEGEKENLRTADRDRATGPNPVCAGEYRRSQRSFCYRKQHLYLFQQFFASQDTLPDDSDRLLRLCAEESTHQRNSPVR